MKALFKTYPSVTAYILLYSLFAFLLSLLCLLFPKAEGFLLINQFHSRLSDDIFTVITCLGNGLFIVMGIIFLIILKKPAWSLQITLSFIASGVVVQLLKHLIHTPRPKLFFQSGMIHCVNGVTCSGFTSFPSGHTTTIFAFTTLLSFYFPDKKWGFLFFLAAAMTGFSRIYLADHFPIDVLCGSFLGVLISMITYLFIPVTILDKKLEKSLFGRQSINLQ
jgi:membrane-associated phospholipid phosphatase